MDPEEADYWERQEATSLGRGCLYGLGCIVGAVLMFAAIVGAATLLWGGPGAFR